MELNPSPGDASPWRRIPEPREVLEHFGEAVGMLVNPPVGSVRSVGYEDINDYPWRVIVSYRLDGELQASVHTVRRQPPNTTGPQPVRVAQGNLNEFWSNSSASPSQSPIGSRVKMEAAREYADEVDAADSVPSTIELDGVVRPAELWAARGYGVVRADFGTGEINVVGPVAMLQHAVVRSVTAANMP
jgi:hypothetical protein